jgi:hypothetical protein
MARLVVKGDRLVIRLSWSEKAAARHGNVRVPVAAVRHVGVEYDWWRALRGVRHRGVWIPGAACIGTRQHHGGRDFVAFRPGEPVLCVELWPTRAPFSLLALSVPDPEATAVALRRLAPRIDATARQRQAIPVPEEVEEVPQSGRPAEAAVPRKRAKGLGRRAVDRAVRRFRSAPGRRRRVRRNRPGGGSVRTPAARR